MKEPVNLILRDGKRLDGMTRIPWRSRKLLILDMTVVSTRAESYNATADRGRSEVVEMADITKCYKPSSPWYTHSFLLPWRLWAQ